MLTPGDKFPDADYFSFQDKVIHFACFALLSFIWCGVGIKDKRKPGSTKRILINYLVFGVVAAVAFEYVQRFIPFRTFDYNDIIANLIGGLIGLLAYFKIPTARLGLH